MTTALLFLVAANVSYRAFPPHDVPGLGWVAFVPLLALLDRVGGRLRDELLVVWLYGAWGYACAYSWVAEVLREFGDLPLPVALLLLLLFCLAGATCFLPLALLRRWWLGRGEDRRGAILVVAAIWLAMESWWPRLFPWYAGLTQHDAPVARQVAELGGIQAVSLVVVLANLGIYELGRAAARRRLQRALAVEAAVAAALVAAALLFGAARLGSVTESAAGTFRAALIQGNIDNAEKTRSEGGAGGASEDVVDRYERLTLTAARHEPDVIVWPETAYPLFVSLETIDARSLAGYSKLERRWARAWLTHRTWLEQLARRIGRPLIVGGLEAEGVPREHGGDRNFNAVLAVHPQQAMTSYRKNVLIPFGEAIPWPLGEWFPGLYERMPRSFRFSPGESLAALELDGRRFAASVCYEAILSELCRRMVVEGDADVLVNLTNDSWFGHSAEPAQHLALASFRAVELRVPFLRATNTGITTYVDPAGNVHEPTALFEEAVRVYEVALHPETGRTLFARLGAGPARVVSFIGVVLAVIAWRRRRGRDGPPRGRPGPRG